MKPSFHSLIGGAILSIAACAASPASVELERSEAGVHAVERHWTEAFVTGDSAYLEQLLAADYVSVNGKAVVRPKAEVIALARKFAATNKGPLPDVQQGQVLMQGDAAIVLHDGPTERSVDVFYYRDGHWQAWYSQHTSKTPGA